MRKFALIAGILCVIGFTILSSGCIKESVVGTQTTLLKLNHSGKIQWISVLENSGYATVRSLAPDTVRGIQISDGFFLAGFFTGTDGSGGLRVIKTDRSGNLIRETRVPAIQDQILFIGRNDDGGNIIITRLGHIYEFSQQGEFLNIRNVSEQLNRDSYRKPYGQETLPVTFLSLARCGHGEIVALVQNHADIYNPIHIVWLSMNGTIRNTMVLNPEGIDGGTKIVPVEDGGLILGRSINQSHPGGGELILLERLDKNGTRLWSTVPGTCDTTYCTYEILGLSETELGQYEIIFQSNEESSSSSSSQTTILVRIDKNGQIQGQEIINSMTGLPFWFFQAGSSSNLRYFIPEQAIKFLTEKDASGVYGILSVSILGTDDGGHLLISTRYM